MVEIDHLYTPELDLPDNSSMFGSLSNQSCSAKPSIAWCYTLLAPAMIFMMTALDRGYQTDLWHHLARGREMWQSGAILNRDAFTYTVDDQPIVDNNWLTQIVAYKLHEIGGLELVQTANSVLLGLTISVLVSMGVRRGASARVAGWVGVLLVAGLTPTLLIRPQTVSMLLFALLFCVMVEAPRKPRLLILAPVLMAIWANVHGAFPIGLVLIGCFTFAACVGRFRAATADARVSPLAMIACLLAGAVATLANPYHVRVYGYVLNTSSRARERVIQEWLRPEVFSLQGGFWLASIVAIAVLLVICRQRVRLWMVTAAVVFGAVSCTSVRMSIWWYLSAAMIAMILAGAKHRVATDDAEDLVDAKDPGRRSALPRRGATIDSASKPSWMAGTVFAVMILAMFICLPAMQRWNPIFIVRSPDRPEDNLAQLTEALIDAAPNARVFCKLEWGEYLSFHLPWQNAVYMDGRIEIYSDTLWDEYRQITTAEPGWQDKLDHYGVTVLLLDRHYHDGLRNAASHSPDWTLFTVIGGGEIYVRNAK